MAAFGVRFESATDIEDRKEQTRLARAEVLRQVPPLFRAFFLPFKTSACTENFPHARSALPETPLAQCLLNALAGSVCSFSLQRDVTGFLPVSLAFTPSIDVSAAWVAQFLCSESWQRLIWK